MTRAVPLPTRDYSVLSPRQYRIVKNRSKPPKPDLEAIAEQERRKETHSRLTTLTSAWQNTIARNRLERQTRLQREVEAEEDRRRALDAEEAKVQKLKRQAKLAEAASLSFAQRPEVRAVNSQLLLHEVQLERDEQILAKERKRLAQQRGDIEFDEEHKRRYEGMLGNEMRLLNAKRARDLECAEQQRRQRQQKADEKAQDLATKRQDEVILAEHFAWELEQERMAQREARRRAKRFQAEVAARNAEMVRYRETLGELADEEDRRLAKEREQVMDEEDARRAAEAKRKQDRLDERQRLIDIEARRQMETKKTHEDFLDKQLAQQHEKERREVGALVADRRRLADERRAEFLQSRELMDAKKKTKTRRQFERSPFPIAAPTPEEQEMERRLQERVKAAKDTQEFQRQQAKEKKEREDAERERDRVEFNYRIEQDRAFLRRAQQYATDLLKKAKEDEDNTDLSYYTDY
jgi:hypothetical protein